MKIKLVLLGLFLSFLMLAATALPVFALPIHAVIARAAEALSDVQLYVVSVLATAAIYGLKVAAQRFGWSPQRGWLSVFLYVAAAGLAFAWGAFKLSPFPAFSDPVSFVSGAFSYVSDLLVQLGPVVGLATLIYNALAKKVFDAAAEKAGIKPASG